MTNLNPATGSNSRIRALRVPTEPEAPPVDVEAYLPRQPIVGLDRIILLPGNRHVPVACMHRQRHASAIQMAAQIMS